MNYIQRYQALRNLVPDGVIGRKTAYVMMQEFDVKDKVKFAHFIGQLRHESMNFSLNRENLNYGAEGLRKTFKKYFTREESLRYAHKPEAIANHVYQNRMGNGDELSGDGWRYRGVGPCQLTGKDTIQAYFKHVGLPVFTDPGVIAQIDHYFRSAVWYWNENDVWDWCHETKTDCIIWTSKKINLGNALSQTTPNGLSERIAYTRQMFVVLGVG